MKQVLVQGHCSQQDGSVTTIDGFYFQNYTRSLQNGNEVLTPLGSPCVSIFCVPLSLYLCMCGFFFLSMRSKLLRAAPYAVQDIGWCVSRRHRRATTAAI